MTKKSPSKKSPRTKSPRTKSPRTKSPRKNSPRTKSPRKKKSVQTRLNRSLRRSKVIAYRGAGSIPDQYLHAAFEHSKDPDYSYENDGEYKWELEKMVGLFPFWMQEDLRQHIRPSLREDWSLLIKPDMSVVVDAQKEEAHRKWVLDKINNFVNNFVTFPEQRKLLTKRLQARLLRVK